MGDPACGLLHTDGDQNPLVEFWSQLRCPHRPHCEYVAPCYRIHGHQGPGPTKAPSRGDWTSCDAELPTASQWSPGPTIRHLLRMMPKSQKFPWRLAEVSRQLQSAPKCSKVHACSGSPTGIQADRIIARIQCSTRIQTPPSSNVSTSILRTCSQLLTQYTPSLPM